MNQLYISLVDDDVLVSFIQEKGSQMMDKASNAVHSVQDSCNQVTKTIKKIISFTNIWEYDNSISVIDVCRLDSRWRLKLRVLLMLWRALLEPTNEAEANSCPATPLALFLLLFSQINFEVLMLKQFVSFIFPCFKAHFVAVFFISLFYGTFELYVEIFINRVLLLNSPIFRLFFQVLFAIATK